MHDEQHRQVKTGGDPLSLSEFMALRNEMSKLMNPARPNVDWKQVEKLSLSFLGAKTIVVDSGWLERLVVSYDLGYWMWVSATFLMMMGLPIEMKIAKKEN